MRSPEGHRATRRQASFIILLSPLAVFLALRGCKPSETAVRSRIEIAEDPYAPKVVEPGDTETFFSKFSIINNSPFRVEIDHDMIGLAVGNHLSELGLAGKGKEKPVIVLSRAREFAASTPRFFEHKVIRMVRNHDSGVSEVHIALGMEEEMWNNHERRRNIYPDISRRISAYLLGGLAQWGVSKNIYTPDVGHALFVDFVNMDSKVARILQPMVTA